MKRPGRHCNAVVPRPDRKGVRPVKTVPLHGRLAAGRVALVDDEDHELVMCYRWRVWEARRPGLHDAGPYAVTHVTRNGKQRMLRMHTLITGYARTDHRNHDGLDNRRQNLRDATAAQNARNRRPNARPGSSQFKGVTWRAALNKWVARFAFDNKVRQIGYFADEIEAARAYDAVARDAFGDFAWLNFPDGLDRTAGQG